MLGDGWVTVCLTVVGGGALAMARRGVDPGAPPGAPRLSIDQGCVRDAGYKGQRDYTLTRSLAPARRCDMHQIGINRAAGWGAAPQARPSTRPLLATMAPTQRMAAQATHGWLRLPVHRVSMPG
jgi:hypothetical protein